MARGHSNVRLENLTTNKNTGAAMIQIEGGATLSTVRELPPLALRREEWKQIGDRMNWWLSPPGTNSGCLWIQFHDTGGRIQIEDLSLNGIHDAMFQCTQMLETLEEAKERLDALESENEDSE